jgi:mycothiol synthase
MTTLVPGGSPPSCLELVERLDGPRATAARTLLRAVIEADDHRGVGAEVLEILAEPGAGFGILAPSREGGRGARGSLDGLAFSRPIGDGHVWDIELTVHPRRRGHGLGDALLTAALDTVPAHTGLRVWAYRPGVAQRRLAARHGLGPAMHLLQLRGDTRMGTRPAPPLPGGMRLRTLAPGDEAGVLATHNAAFTTEQLSEHQFRTRLARPNMGPDHLVVAETADGAVAGYCWMASPRPDGEGAGHGELVLLAVHPDHHGKGLGRTLTVAGMDLLARRGVERCMIYGDASNEPAIRLYRKLGFEPHHIDVALSPGGTLPWPGELAV